MLLFRNFFDLVTCREWKDLKYEVREAKFACENESSNGINVIGEISLPQFSSAEVPKVHFVRYLAEYIYIFFGGVSLMR